MKNTSDGNHDDRDSRDDNEQEPEEPNLNNNEQSSDKEDIGNRLTPIMKEADNNSLSLDKLRKEQNQPQRLLGNKYQLLVYLRSGYFADVWKAHDTNLNRLVAVKILTSQLSEQSQKELERFEQRFRQEAQTIASLRDKNVVEIYDFGVDQFHNHPLPYIVMPLAKGSLSKTLSKEGYISLNRVVSYVKQIASGLHHAHQRGIIHGDIKPGNILIMDDSYQNEELVVSDFNICINLNQTLLVSQRYGTPEYMAPELFATFGTSTPKGYPSQRSDLYSLAVLTYELLAGNLPFPIDERSNRTPYEQLAFLHDTDRCPDEIPGIPPSVMEVLLKGLAKKPEERYDNTLQFAEALEQASQPIVSAQSVPTSSESAFDMTRREFNILATEVVLACLASALGVLSSQQSKPVDAYLGHNAPVEAITMSQDGKYLISADQEGNIHIVNPITMQKLGEYPGHQGTMIRQLQGVPHNPYISSLDMNSNLDIWSPQSGIVYRAMPRDENNLISNLSWSTAKLPDIALIASNQIRIFDDFLNKELSLSDPFFTGNTMPFTDIAWSPDTSLLAASTKDGIVTIFDGEGAKQRAVYTGHKKALIQGVAWAPARNRNILASFDDNQYVRIYSIQIGKTRETTSYKDIASYKPDSNIAIKALAWSPLPKQRLRLVIGCDDGTVLVWDEKSRQFTTYYKAHKSAVNAVVWFLDGLHFATASDDKTVLIWATQL